MNRPVDDSSSSDTKLLLQEAEQLFKREDDIKDIADIRKMQQEVQLQCNSQLRDAKEIIKVMTSLVGKKEAEIVPPSYVSTSPFILLFNQLMRSILTGKSGWWSLCWYIFKVIDTITEVVKALVPVGALEKSMADHAAALKKVSNKENLNSQMDSLLHAIDEKKQRIDALHNSHASLMQQLQDARSGQHQSAAVDSRTVYALSLYSKISNITWEYGSSPETLSTFSYVRCERREQKGGGAFPVEHHGVDAI
eukprot:gene27708-36468_t